MGLIKKIFGAGSAETRASGAPEEETSVEKDKGRNEPRRQLIQVVLRDTKQKHGIPADWIDSRILSVMTREHKSGMHVQLLVRKGDDQLLQYVHAFQEAFWHEISRTDPFAREWLFSLAWQFDGKATRTFAAMPVAGDWIDDGDTQPPEAGDTQPPEDDAEDLETDLQALYAIRDAAMSGPAGLGELPAAKPRPHRSDS